MLKFSSEVCFLCFHMLCIQGWEIKKELEALCIWIGLVSFEHICKVICFGCFLGNSDVIMSGTSVLSLLSPLASFIIVPCILKALAANLGANGGELGSQYSSGCFLNMCLIIDSVPGLFSPKILFYLSIE